MKLTVVPAIFFLFVLCACDAQQQDNESINSIENSALSNRGAASGKSEERQEYYPSGKLKVKIREVSSKSNLKLYQAYHENGTLKTEGVLANNNLKEGEWTTYHENGKLESVALYKNGMEHGSFTSYHDNGQLWSERTYKDGKIWEVISNFDRQGNKRDQGTLKNGSGSVKTYDADGNLIEVANYKDGVKQ